MALKDEATQKLVDQLVAERIIPQRDVVWLESEERYSGRQFSPQSIVALYMDDEMRFRLRPSQVESFKAAAVEAGLTEEEIEKPPVVEMPTASAMAEEHGWGDTFSPEELTSIGRTIRGASYGGEGQAIGGLPVESAIRRMREQQGVSADRMFEVAMQKEMMRILGAYGEDLDFNELFASDDEDAMIAVLQDKLDMSPEQARGIVDDATTAGLAARNKRLGIEEEIDAVAEEEEVLLSDDDKLKAKKEFEVLEKAYPGRYMFDTDKGMIYEVGTGILVDKHGDPIEADPETQEMPEGISVEDAFSIAAQAMEPPWAQYDGVDADTYYQLLDVVEHPEWYHGEGINRFTSGGSFIGGFDRDYAVAQDESVALAQRDQRWAESVSTAGGGMMGGDYRDYLADQIQTVRRPWYDPGDNWALFAGMSPEAVAQEQQKLITMGALDANEVVNGVWGPAEAGAVEKMMVIANGRAEKIDDIDPSFWDEYWGSVANSGAASRRGFVRPAYEKLDPARAELTIKDTVRRLLGRDATEDELADLGMHMADMHRQSFVADVGAMEAEYNAETRAIDTGDAQSAGEYQGVDWEAQFMDKFNQTHEAELARYDRTQDVAQRQQLIGGALNGFMNQLGGGIGGGSMGGR